MEYSYYNNSGPTIAKLSATLAKAKPNYLMVEQARRFSDQAKLHELLERLEPGDTVRSKDSTTLVAGSLLQLVETLLLIVRDRKATLVLDDGGTLHPGSDLAVSLLDLAQHHKKIHGLQRQGKSGRPKLSFDVERAKLLKTKGKSWKEIERAIGVSARTIRDRLEKL